MIIHSNTEYMIREKETELLSVNEQGGKNQREGILQRDKVGDGNKLKVEEEFEDSQEEKQG